MTDMMELPDAVARISASENLQVVVYQVVSPLFECCLVTFFSSVVCCLTKPTIKTGIGHTETF